MDRDFLDNDAGTVFKLVSNFWISCILCLVWLFIPSLFKCFERFLFIYLFIFIMIIIIDLLYFAGLLYERTQSYENSFVLSGTATPNSFLVSHK